MGDPGSVSDQIDPLHKVIQEVGDRRLNFFNILALFQTVQITVIHIVGNICRESTLNCGPADQSQQGDPAVLRKP